MRQASRSRGDRRGGPLWWLVLAVAAVGLALVVGALVGQRPDAAELDRPVGSLPSQSAAPDRTDSSGTPEVEPARETPLGPSRPVSIAIPDIGVSSEVIALGRAPDGTLAVPQPGPDLDKAAWFEQSPTPGQPGPSVIEGHVATDESGPSVFYDLADLRPGDRVRVARADGSSVVFEVDALREFDKDAFPTKLVYGGDISRPTLRVITCSSFDPSVGSHTANLVVFTSLVRVTGG